MKRNEQSSMLFITGGVGELSAGSTPCVLLSSPAPVMVVDAFLCLAGNTLARRACRRLSARLPTH